MVLSSPARVSRDAVVRVSRVSRRLRGRARASWLILLAALFASMLGARASIDGGNTCSDVAGECAAPRSAGSRPVEPGNRAVMVTPAKIRLVGIAAFRETRTEGVLTNTQRDEELVVHGVSTDDKLLQVLDFNRDETICPGQSRTYTFSYVPYDIGEVWMTILYHTNKGSYAQLVTIRAYRNPYYFTPLIETVPFDVPVEYDLVMHNPLETRVDVRSAFTMTPEVELQPSVQKLKGMENTDADDLLTQVTKWSLLAGERVTICRLRVLIRRDEFLARDDSTSIQGTLALNISSEPHLMRVPFEFTPRRDVVHAVEKLLEFEDMANTRDKRTKHLHIFNARKTAIEIRSMFTEDADREISIKFGRGTVIPPLTTVRVARITRTGVVEGYFKGIIHVHTNVSSHPLRIPYTAQVTHGDLMYDADQFIFQAPVGKYGESVPVGAHAIKKIVRIKNTFSKDVKLYAWSFPLTDLAVFPIAFLSDVVGKTVRKGESFDVEVNVQPKKYTTSSSSTLTLYHNNSLSGTKIPVIVYSGELTAPSTVNFGIVGVGLRRSVRVKFTNLNPVPLDVHTLIIKGTRSVRGSTFSLAEESGGDIEPDEVSEIDGCIESSGNVCTQVLKGSLESGASLELKLVAAPNIIENLEEKRAELAITTSLGVSTVVHLQMLSTNGKVISEDGDINIAVPTSELFQSVIDGSSKHEVMVHSTHEVVVGVSSFFETESDFLEFAPSADTALAGISSSIGSIVFDTSRQRNELSHFKNTLGGAQRAHIDDVVNQAVSKIDVRSLEKLQRSMARLQEDGALIASGRVVFSSEAQDSHQVVTVTAKVFHPRFLEISSEDISTLDASGHTMVVSRDFKTTISVVNPSSTRTLCVRILPVLTHSTRTRRRGAKHAKDSLFQTNVKAAGAYASVDESNLYQRSADTGFRSKYKVEREAVCLKPEQRMDVLSTVFDPRTKMRTYVASICIKNDHTLLECVELVGHSGNSVIDIEVTHGTNTYVYIAMLLVIVTVYITAPRREVDSPAGSPHEAPVVGPFSEPVRDVTLTAAPAAPEKTEIAVNETTALKTSDDGRKPTETDSPTHQSDDSALNKTEVTLVEETAPERVGTPRKEIVRRGGRDSLSKKNTPTDKSLVEKKVRGAQKAEKPKRRVKSEKKASQPQSLRNEGDEVSALPDETENPPNAAILRPRSVVRNRTLSTASSDIATSIADDNNPEAHFDAYNSLFSEVIARQGPPQMSPRTTTPPATIADITPPHSQAGSVRDYDLWSAPQVGNVTPSAGTTGLHSSNLFSFTNDTQATRSARSLHGDDTNTDPFSPAASTRSLWASMLTQWEEEGRNRSRGSNTSQEY